MIFALRVLAAFAGAAVLTATGASLLGTIVLPRGVASRLSSAVFVGVHRIYALRLRRAAGYEVRDRVLATYGPVALLVLLQVWIASELVGFALLQLGIGGVRPVRALALSGSSLLTLGTVPPHGWAQTLLTYAEASVGLVTVAMLISYLPALYSSFSKREAFVAKLEVRANTPPTGSILLWRAWVIGRFDKLGELWVDAEDFFTELSESHTSYPALVYFRSPQPEHSWVTAAGAVLDGASLRAAVVDAPPDIEAQLALRAGFIALRRIAQYFDGPAPANPQPDDPITILRSEFDEVLAELAAAGVPIKADRDQAWRDFAGWRVNYDVALVALAAMTQAPYAPWSSDRTLARARVTPRIRRRRVPVRPGGMPPQPR